MSLLNFFRRSRPDKRYRFRFELDREDDGRFIAEILDIPGALAYGETEPEAVRRAAALAIRVVADRIEAGKEEYPSDTQFTFTHA